MPSSQPQDKVSIRSLTEEMLEEELERLVMPLIEKVEALQNEFEESLLDQELWTSVDLLQNVGLQHHQVFGALVDEIQKEDLGTDDFKAHLREGRTSFSEWLFDRFKHISAQISPTQGAQQAFDELLAKLEKVCQALQQSEISLVQHQELLVSSPRDALYVRAGKLVKRMLRKLGVSRFQRRFSFRRLAIYYLLGQLPERLFNIANMLGEAEFFLLRRVKGLSEEIDQAYNSFLAALDEEGIQAAELVDRAAIIRKELDESFRLVGAEVMKYYNDIRHLLETEIYACLRDLIVDARRAGTFELPQRRFQLMKGKQEQCRERIAERLQLWGRYQVGFTGFYTMGLEMTRVQNRLRHAVDETVLKVNGRLWQRLDGQLECLRQRLEETAITLREGRDSRDGVEDVRSRIEQERDELLDFLGQRQRQLQSIEASAEINQLIDLLIERFRQLADQTVDSFHILEEEDFPGREGDVPRDVELKIAPVRAVVRSYLEGELIRRLGDVNGAMIGQVRDMEAGIDDLMQSANFSLSTVVIELREVGKKPGDLVPVALTRLQRGLEGFQGRFQTIQAGNQETGERVIREVADTARLLKQLILEETVREMHRKIDARRGGWSLRGLTERRGKADKPGDAMPQTVLPVQPLPALESSDVEEESGRAEALDYEGILDLEESLTDRVPFAYRQLFRTTPLEVSEFLAERSGALGIIETACKRWRQRRFASVVIIGEQGSGKTSLINCAMEQKLRGLPLVRHRIAENLLDEERLVSLLSQLLDAEGESLVDLEKEIARSYERRIVVLEDLHQLHLRAMHGLDLLLRFLEFIDATGAHILWMVSIELSAWHYLDHIQQISRHFAFRIETGHLSSQELEGAVMARHRVTGYRLRFIGGGKEDEQDSLRRDFFDQLNRACGGNVFSAIFYWLHSVEKVEGDVLVIKPLEELKLEFLQILPLGELLSLAMIIQHGGLSTEQFSTVFRITCGEGKARLTHLERLGVLKRAEGASGNDLYAVNPILYQPIVMLLKRRNLFK